jgi:hypothetical protein
VRMHQRGQLGGWLGGGARTHGGGPSRSRRGATKVATSEPRASLEEADEDEALGVGEEEEEAEEQDQAAREQPEELRPGRSTRGGPGARGAAAPTSRPLRHERVHTNADNARAPRCARGAVPSAPVAVRSSRPGDLD